MYRRLLHNPITRDHSFFLFGPRGTEKTWWLQHQLADQDTRYVNLLDAKTYQTLQASPQRLMSLVGPTPGHWIVIDEIQRTPELLNEVHRLIEEENLRFILTGSSARKLRRAGTNLLAGRAHHYRFHPLLPQEIGTETFRLDHALRYGMLPSVWQQPHPETYLHAYITTYIQQELLEEGLSRHLESFARFLEVASLSQGSPVNLSAISRDTAVSRKAVTTYFQILEDLLLGHFLPPFSRHAKRRLSQQPTFYFTDVGLYQSLRPRGPFELADTHDGAALESLFYQTLRGLNDWLEMGYSLHHWRTSDGKEVDFVCYGPKGLFAFEINRSANLSHQDFKGLTCFAKDYPMAKIFMIYGGDKAYNDHHARVIPYEQALFDLPTLLGENAPPEPG